MAITFPRELPSYDHLVECTFALVDGTSINRFANSQAVSAVEYYNPYHNIKVGTRPLYGPERRVWSAWKNSLRGGMKSFLAYDSTRQFAIAYPTGCPLLTDFGGAWNGQGVVTDLSARSATISGVAVGYIASPGDHVGFVLDGHYTLHEITEGGTANGSGILSVAFDPYIALEMFSVGATAVLYKPKARFIIDQGSWEEANGMPDKPIPIMFTGSQVF